MITAFCVTRGTPPLLEEVVVGCVVSPPFGAPVGAPVGAGASVPVEPVFEFEGVTAPVVAAGALPESLLAPAVIVTGTIKDE